MAVWSVMHKYAGKGQALMHDTLLVRAIERAGHLRGVFEHLVDGQRFLR